MNLQTDYHLNLAKPVKCLEFLSYCTNPDYVVLTHIQNEFTLYDSEFRLLREGKTDFELAEYAPVMLNPKALLLGVVSQAGTLYLLNQDFLISWQRAGSFVFCCWNEAGTQLWTVEKINSEELVCSVFNQAGELVASKEYQDLWGDSMISINVIPNSKGVILDHGAGQDGCLTVFATLEEQQAGTMEIQLRSLNEARSLTCTSFNGAGTEFICLDNDDATYYRFSYPALAELGAYSIPEATYINYSLIYLDNETSPVALANWGDNYYVLDVNTMTLVGALEIVGYPVKEIQEIFPRLKEEGTMSEIAYLIGTDKYIWGICRNELLVIKKDYVPEVLK